MTVLIILGNLNQFTFGNSIVAANAKAVELFKKPLSRVEVFHSSDSFDSLQRAKTKDETNWVNHIEQFGISERILVHRTVELTSTQQTVEEFVKSIEGIISCVPQGTQELLLDLTNGTTFSKNLLSTAAYLLDIPHQYMIDVPRLSKVADVRGFLGADTLKEAYISAPDSTYLDNIAYLSLSEVFRYKRIIDTHTIRYKEICEEDSDANFFSSNLRESIRIKLEGDRRKDNAIYRIAASSISSSAEDLISRLIHKFVIETDARTLGEKLGAIRAQVEKNAPDTFDIEFYRKFNDFVLYLRNSSTHKGQVLTDLEKFKADLAVKMTFPFIEFYTDIISKLLSSNEMSYPPVTISELVESIPAPGHMMYYGLDGDDTGKILEELFFLSKNETHFRKISQSITKAIARIRNQITKQASKGAIIFEAGDDLLFKGSFSKDDLMDLQNIYSDETPGLTCSIGFGSSFQEVYLALKLAKTRPGKNSIAGIQFKQTSSEHQNTVGQGGD